MIPVSRPLIGEEEQSAVREVLASGMLSQGPKVAEFEEAFAHLVGGRECVAVNSGTSALLLALLAHGVGPGDEVIVPSFTFAATANSVVLTGARPVFADIDRSGFLLDPDAVAAAVTARTVAIIPVHLFGHPAHMAPIRALAARHGLLVIEDAAQAHGALDGGIPVGALGDSAAFSFYPTKNMTTGEGGMAVTADADVARKARLLRNQGMSSPQIHDAVGFNMRMTDVAAAMGVVQLRRLPWFTRRRREIARMFDAALRHCPGVDLPPTRAEVRHVYNQFTVRCADRDRLRRELVAADVETRVYYPTPVHEMVAFRSCEQDLPETQSAAREVLSLPMGPHLTDDEVAAVIAAVMAARP